MSKPLKIAIVSNTSWSIYNFRLGLIRTLKELGHDVFLISPKDNFSAKLIAEGFSYQNIYMDNYGTSPFNDLKTLRQFIKIYKTHAFDLIFHYTIKPNIYGSLAAYRCNIPSVAITTGLGHLLSYKNVLVQFIVLQSYKMASRLSQQVWFLNEDDQHVFVEKGIVKKEKTYLLQSEGVNTDRFKPKRPFECSPVVKFLFAGRIIWDKGVGEYVNAAKIIKTKYPNVEFQLLGFINPNNPNSVPIIDIEKWQKEGILNYLGETTDIRKYIDEACCVVLPSYYREGISRVLLEAASMGKPIITTDNVGCRDVVDHKVNGYLCQKKNTEDLALQMEQFMQLTCDERKAMGNNGRQKVLNEFDEKLIIQNYLDFIARFQNNA